MKIAQRDSAVALRSKGYSMNEISKCLRVSKSSVSLWVRTVSLSGPARARLAKKARAGQLAGAKKKREIVERLEQRYLEAARCEFAKRPDYEKILCAVIYWCEGAKNPRNGLTFTNSDPALVAKFLELLRKTYVLDEKKFHPCIHLHSYHVPARQLAFWSKVTKIKVRQFTQPYRKQNGGKQIREGYQGCISVRYHSNDLARRVLATAKAFLGVW